MLLGSIAFVAIGKAVIFELLGLHQKWWRYFSLGDVWPICAPLAVASGLMLLVFVLAKPFRTACRARSSILDFIFTLRAARRRPRSPAARSSSARERRARDRRQRSTCSSSAPAPAARWSSASSS